MSSLFLSSSRDTASIPAMMTCFTKHCTRVKTSLYVIMAGAQGLLDFRLRSRATGAPQLVDLATAGGLHSLNCLFQSPTPAPTNGLGNFGQIWSRSRQPTAQIARHKTRCTQGEGTASIQVFSRFLYLCGSGSDSECRGGVEVKRNSSRACRLHPGLPCFDLRTLREMVAQTAK